jgi:predicted DNA-binding transcriptional regulator AlpA
MNELPELLKHADCTRMLNLSRRTWYTIAPRVPGRVRIGGCVRYRRGEVQKWLEAGCPLVAA